MPWDLIIRIVVQGLAAVADVVETASKKTADEARAHAAAKVAALEAANKASNAEDAAWRKANDAESARKPSRADVTAAHDVARSADLLEPSPLVGAGANFDLSDG